MATVFVQAIRKLLMANAYNKETSNKLFSNYSDYKTSQYMTPRQVPVLFSTDHGLHIRKLECSSNYLIIYCDLRKWVKAIRCR